MSKDRVVRYIGTMGGVELEPGVDVLRGETVSVTSDVAERLVANGDFEVVDAKKGDSR